MSSEEEYPSRDVIKQKLRDNFDGKIYYYSATNTEGDKRIPKLTVEISL